MKKVLVVVALVLAIATSVVAGTLALYSTTIDDIADNNNQVVAKQFVLTGNGNETFNTTVKIAPTETVKKTFSIQNFSGSIITETDMDVALTANLIGVDNKGIANLSVKVMNGETEVATGTTDANGNATLSWSDDFTAGTAQTHTFDVVITWTSSANDINYVNAANQLKISVVGTQA